MEQNTADYEHKMQEYMEKMAMLKKLQEIKEQGQREIGIVHRTTHLHIRPSSQKSRRV
jgi:hypothetical protein